ncbi:MAG: hypothetical protein R2873_33385 [Caldilineaceae bacterium]
MPVEGGFCGPTGSASIYLNRGEIVFDFSMPDGFRDANLSNLRVSLRSDGGWAVPPATAIYDWDAENWLTLESPQLGINDIDFADGLLNEDGKVRLRLSAQGNGGGCLYLGLGISGVK